MTHSSLNYVVHPGGALSGRFRVPGDKSISHRSIMLGALADGETVVEGFLEGADSLATLQAFRAMGVKIDGPVNGRVVIQGVGLDGLQAPEQPLNLGNSGTSMRLLAGLLAAQRFPVTLVGDSSLSKRPMRRVTGPLGQMGAEIATTEQGTPPLHISPVAKLQGIEYDMPMASAQVKSSVLLAGLYADSATSVTEPAPTRDHTERMLQSFGYEVSVQGARATLQPGGRLQATTVDVPGDISSAAFFIVAASLVPGSEIVLEHVGINPTRTGIIHIMRAMGANITLLNERFVGAEPVADLQIKAASLQGITIPEEYVPLAIDEFPVIFIAAAYAEGETRLTGARELRVKESDRIQVMADGLQALGVDAQPTEDGMLIQGQGGLDGGKVDSHGDHRIAMAFAVAGMRARGDITITDCANVATSFPQFEQLAQKAGMDIHLNREAVVVPVITVDGPSGVGKGTIASQLAQELGWHLLDSGALYRVLALAAEQHGIAFDNESALEVLAEHLDVQFSGDGSSGIRITLEGDEVTDDIRTETVAAAASRVAQYQGVRRALLQRQRAFRQTPGLVADGRDMGTVVFADAEVKVFLTASAEERAQRRYKQLKEKGIDASLSALVETIKQRDQQDMQRQVAPLRPAEDAHLIDTTNLSVDQVYAQVMQLVLAAEIEGL